MVLIESPAEEKQGEAPHPAMLLPRPPRFVLGKTPVDRISMEYATILVTEALLHPGELPPLTIVGPNAQLVTLAEKNEAFAAAMQAADLAVPDGISVVMASRILGVPIPERVTGGDLMDRLCAEAARYGFRVFLLGGLPGSAMMAAYNLRLRYPGLNICGTYCPPMGFERDAAEVQRIRDDVNAAAPDLLCVALGAPKQEIWMQENRDKLRVGAILPVGGAFDTTAGLRRRAPKWLQIIHLEWLFRLAMEPRRLWRRFVLLVLRDLARQKVATVRRVAARLRHA